MAAEPHALRQVGNVSPTLHLDMTAGDADLGYEAYLHTAYELAIKRVVGLRAQRGDPCLRSSLGSM